MDNLLNFKDGDSVLVAGELGEEITQALYTIYKKEVEPTTGVVLESQIFQNLQRVNDFLDLNKSSDELKKDSVGMLYGVSDLATSVKDISTLSQVVSTMTDDQLGNSAVILKPTKLEEGVDDTRPLSQISLEEFCKHVGLPVYFSVDSYMSARRDRINEN